MTALIVVEAVAIVLLGLLVAGLLRSHAEILRRLHELGAGIGEEDAGGAGRPFDVVEGVPAPGETSAMGHDVSGVTPQSEAVGVGVVGAGHHTLLAFLSSGCLTCAAFWDAFAAPRQLDLPDGTRLVIVTKGPEHESVSEVAKLAPSAVPLVMSSDAFTDYGIPGSPFFVFVDGPSGRVVGEGSATSWVQVASLLSQSLADRRSHGRDLPVVRTGQAASDASRADRIDRELAAAGIHPGHPSLYEAPQVPQDEVERS